jgi:hypothetical protein
MPETTKNYHRIPVRSKKKGADIVTITLGKGIKALYDAKNKEILTYLLPVSKYTMDEAKKWVKNHKSKSSLNAAVSIMVECRSLAMRSEKRYHEKKLQVLDMLQ